MTVQEVTADTATCEEPDARRTADAATAEGLLRCWARETGLGEPPDGVLRIDLPGDNRRLEADVMYWSPAGMHRFGPPRLRGRKAPGDVGPDEGIDAVSVARWLVVAAGARPEAAADLAGKVADSARRTERHVSVRRGSPADPPETTPFLAAERALLLGHPLHPAPKSREGFSDAEADTYSPELRGGFPLHWFAADPSVVSSDCVSGTSAEKVVESVAGGVPGGSAGAGSKCPPDTVLIPVHPWQAREVRDRPGVRELFEEGALHDLGEAGPAWYPTASLRTVYRPDSPVMLKLSLGVSITNSKRENLRPELRRGAEIHRLLDAGLAEALRAAHPGFGIVRDPGWLAVNPRTAGFGGQRPESGLEVVLRDNPFGSRDRVVCVAGLVAPRPDLGRSGLAARVEDLAAGAGRPVPEVAEEWFARYLRRVVVPVLWLYGAYGVGLEAHQQNTLVALDDEGWPEGGWYRDNQGYYLSARRSGELEKFLPGVGLDGDCRCDDAVIDERIGYYLGVNNVLGLVGAFGSQRLASERRLLAAFRDTLRSMHAEFGDDLRLAATLADAPTLRCKANLLTRVAGLDELVGPLETQSVYRDIPNPTASVPAAGYDGDGEAGRPRSSHGVVGAPLRRFAVDLPEGLFTLRAAEPEVDDELVHAWMNDPEVARFWELAKPVDEIAAYLRVQVRAAHSAPYVGLLDGTPVSYWEVYRADLDPLARHYRARPGDVGVHLLLGPSGYRGRGLGAGLLSAVAEWQLGERPASGHGAPRVVAEPDVRNGRSVRAFERAGFTRVADVDLPDKRAALMIRDRRGTPA